MTNTDYEGLTHGDTVWLEKSPLERPVKCVVQVRLDINLPTSQRFLLTSIVNGIIIQYFPKTIEEFIEYVSLEPPKVLDADFA